MHLRHRVLKGPDDALIVWTADDVPAGLRGFAVQRTRATEQLRWGEESEWVANVAPFGTLERQRGTRQPSDEWPFRAFSWLDDEAPGEGARYRVIPVFWDGGPRDAEGTDWSPWLRVWPHASDVTPSFNRDRDRSGTTSSFHGGLNAFLGGVGYGELFAAPGRLDDPMVLDRILGLGARAHVALGEVDAPPEVRAALLAARVDLRPAPAIAGSFCATTDTKGRALHAWTASLPWTTEALSQQAGHALLVRSRRLAAGWLRRWREPPRSAAPASAEMLIGAARQAVLQLSVGEPVQAASELVARGRGGAHAGLLVVDPCSSKPVVRMELPAPKAGALVLRGEPALAEAAAVHVEGICRRAEGRPTRLDGVQGTAYLRALLEDRHADAAAWGL